MKTSPLIKILSFFALIVIFSCSKKEDPIGSGPENLSIVLSSDAGGETLSILQLDQMVTFTITGNDGEDYTSASKIFIDGVEIPGASHTFSEVGAFEVKAEYGSITSNLLNFQVLADTERALTIDVTRAM